MLEIMPLGWCIPLALKFHYTAVMKKAAKPPGIRRLQFDPTGKSLDYRAARLNARVM